MAGEALASEQYYTSGRKSRVRRRMPPHTFVPDKSSSTSSGLLGVHECIGDFEQIVAKKSSEGGGTDPGQRSGERKGAGGNPPSDLIEARLAQLISTPVGTSTRGLNAQYECWYCGQRIRTTAIVDSPDPQFSFSAMHANG